MIISGFNRYFEKHGRVTYIVLGVIISFIFVIFVTPGSLGGGGRRGLSSLGTMYGKKLKVKEMTHRMACTELAFMLRTGQSLSQRGGHEAQLGESLRIMRALHEAKARGLDNVSDAEVVAAIHDMPFFKDENGVFSKTAFTNFKENYLVSLGLTGQDFDQIVRENLIVERLEKEETKDVTVDDKDVDAWVGNYTVRSAEIPEKTATAGQASDEEIEAFFKDRRSELKLERQRAVVVASVDEAKLVEKLAGDPSIAPTEEELTRQYEAMKETIYKGKTFEEVKERVTTAVRARKVGRAAEKVAADLAKAAAEIPEGEAAGRLAAFTAQATATGVITVTDCDFFGTGTVIPGLEGNSHVALADAIRKLDKVGQVTPAVRDAAAYRVAWLKAIKEGELPQEITPEVRTLIVDKLLEENALKYYNETIAPFKDKVAGCKSVWDLLPAYQQELAKDETLSDEQKESKARDYQDMLSSQVRPFFHAEQRSYKAAIFRPEDYLEQVKLTDEEIAAGYEARSDKYQKVEARLSMILLKTDATMDDAAKAAKKARAEEALAKLQEGTEFEEIVQEYSEDEDTKDRQGDTLLKNVKDFDSAIRTAIATMEVDQTSGVIETANGYAIVKVAEKVPARTLDEVKEELVEELKMEAAKRLAQEAAQELSDALVRTFDKAKDNGEAPEAAAVFDTMAKEFPKATVQLEENVGQSGEPNVLAREAALANRVFSTTADDPFTDGVEGNLAAYVGCLMSIEPPYLATPDDAVILSTLKNTYKHVKAGEAAKAEAIAAADRINAALKENPDLAKAAGELTFKEVEPFNRINSMYGIPGLPVRNAVELYDVLSKAEKKTIVAPQKTYMGYVLVYYDDFVVPDNAETATMKDNVKNYLLRQEQIKVLTTFYEKLEKESDTRLVEGVSTR